MKWYNNMSEQERNNYNKVIVVCGIGAIIILLIPVVVHLVQN